MQAPTLAGRYRLDAELGHGGMATVWRGVDLELERPVAVKVLELSANDHQHAAERFRREARTTAALSHPNIVTLFDTGVDSGTAFLVMELLPGPTLAERLVREGPLPVADVLSVALQVCAALGAAHTSGVIHRDIKPANLSYARDGRVKVLDFGITYLVEAITTEQVLTTASTVLGTAAYLSPEQIRGTPLDGRADLYALGCVLTELLTGSPPFVGEQPLNVIAQHLHGVPAPVSAVRPDLPVALVDVIALLLDKDPNRRPASASELATLLAAIAADERSHPIELFDRVHGVGRKPAPTVAASPSSGRRGRRRISWVLGAGLLVVTVSLIAALVTRAGQNGNAAITAPPRRSGSTSIAPIAPTVNPTPTSSTAATPSPTPKPVVVRTTTPVSPASVPAPATPSQAITALRAAIANAVDSGELGIGPATDLDNRLDDLTRSLTSQPPPPAPPGQPGHPGPPSDASHKVSDLAKQISNLAHGGQLTSAGQQALATPLAELERLIPPAP